MPLTTTEQTTPVVTQSDGPSHRSYSQLRQYRTCGEQYRLERIEKAPSRPSVPAVAGVAIHTGTELVDCLILDWQEDADIIAAHGINAAISAYIAETDKHEANGWGDGSWKSYGKQDYAWFKNTGIPNSIKAYVGWRFATKWELADVPGFGPAIEVPFYYWADGSILVHGFIDRVFKSPQGDGTFVPVDIKSGLKPKTNEQLGLYGCALSKALNWRAPWGYYVYGLKSGEASITPPLRLHWTDEQLASVYGPLNRAIDMGLFLANPGDACMHCGVSNSCNYVQAVV